MRHRKEFKAFGREFYIVTSFDRPIVLAFEIAIYTPDEDDYFAGQYDFRFFFLGFGFNVGTWIDEIQNYGD